MVQKYDAFGDVSVMFSRHLRHQRAALHPADGDEDEQERTAGPRERQRDPGLTPRPFDPFPDPPTFDPKKLRPLFSCPLRLEKPPWQQHRPQTERDRPRQWGHISNAVFSLAPPPSSSCFSPSLSPSGAAVPPPSSQTAGQTQEDNNVECCIILLNQLAQRSERGALKTDV